MLTAVIDNPEIENFLKIYHLKDIDSVIEDILLEFVQQKYEQSSENKLKLFEKLIAENQKVKLHISPETDLSELANEVNSDLF
jgi:hypothetical protein